ncbi:MAG: NAD-dependent epimerase/dehydratase family protein [Planctomycetota bacterium]
MAKILITGGAGFIGSHIAEAAARKGDEVVVLDDLSAGSRENLEGAGSAVTLQIGDVCDPAAVARAVRGVDAVFHLAALTSVPESLKDPLRFHQVNVGGTLAALEAARKAGVRRFLFASSCAVYGETGETPAREDAPPSPLSPYAATKLAGEGYGRAYRTAYGLAVTSLRLFNVFGPRQTADSPYAAVVPTFLSALTSGERPVVYGDGRQTRDLVYVEDAASAFLTLGGEGEGPSALYNVGTGRAVSVLEILERAAGSVGATGEADFLPARPGEIRNSVADVSRLTAETGFAPAVPFPEGMENTARWARSNSETRHDATG